MESQSRLPYNGLIQRVCAPRGEDWRNLPSPEIDGAWGVAIIRSILDGVINLNGSKSFKSSSHLRVVASHLGVDTETLWPAFMRLSLNGILMHDNIRKDKKALNDNDIHAWCHYAGYASGVIGNVTWQPKRRRQSTEGRSA